MSRAGPRTATAAAPPLTAPRRGFVLPGVASPASAPAPRPPHSTAPGPPPPRRPLSRALSAPAAPRVPVGAAPRDAQLQPRAALLRAERAENAYEERLLTNRSRGSGFIKFLNVHTGSIWHISSTEECFSVPGYLPTPSALPHPF
ncbi:uncharacterized protein LOC113598708 isoform X2 [Acinonyx jubatus]|uniref:Uncharacterized protein LOC113598708 isoform X2 n=1 Tax=Acinonyx jubatus TaxID=32536 RepID=A0ABM3Q330_ACIJB|nr:uncharacterized protein LOC113598708 isoform X2 [Acinonyx jubatus]